MAEIVSAFPTSIAMDDSGVQRNAEAFVYSVADTGFTTPLAITDLQGVPLTGGKLTTTTGQFPQFKAPPGVTQVLVLSGGRVTLLTDVSVFSGAALESATAAAGSAGDADQARAGSVAAKVLAEKAAADAIAVGATTDAQMTAIQASPTSAFSVAQKATIDAAVGKKANSADVYSKSATNSAIDAGIAGALILSAKNGMIADGTTDCSAAFQALIDASAAAMRPIELTPGVYYMGTTNIGAPVGTRIRGLSSGLNRFGTNGVILKWSLSTTGTCFTVNGDNTWLENFAIDANGASATGLLVLSGFESRFDNVRVIRSAVRGLWIRAISNSSYRNVYVDNCGSATLPAVQISSVSKSLNTIDVSGIHIERQPGTALQIGPSTLTGTSDIVPEFFRIHGLHIEAVTDNGGAPNTEPLVLITLGRSIALVDPFLFGGPGPLLKHAALTSHAANAVLGGLQIIGGTLLGNASPNAPTNLIQLVTGNEFSVVGTRFDGCTGAAIDVGSAYGDRVFISPECIFTSRVGSARADARTVFDQASITRNPMRVQGHLHLNATAKTSPSVSTALAGSTGAPTFVAGSSDMLGGVKFGSGTAPAAGQIMFHVTFNTQYTNVPMVLLTPNNNDTRLLGLYVVRTASGFDVYAGNAPTASQPATQFEVTYMVVGVTS